MDERSYKRVEVDLDVAASVGTRSMRAMIYDLSMDGCLIEACDGPLPAESSAIDLHILDGQVTRGTLVWTKGNFGGVKFAELMHEAWVQHLGLRPRTQMNDFRDQFGRQMSIPGQRFNRQP